MPDLAEDRRTDVRRRIQILYLVEYPYKDTPRGALRWYDRQAGFSINTVARWFSGERNPSEQSLRQLEMIEENLRLKHGDDAFDDARSRLEEYLTEEDEDAD